MNISPKCSRLNLQLEALVQKINEAMQTVVRRLIGAADQWVVTVDDLNISLGLVQIRQVRIIIP